MVIKDLIDDDLVMIDQFSKTLALYICRGLEKGTAIYFYAIDPSKRKSDVDKLSWIKDVAHEEYDMLSLTLIDGSKEYYQSRVLNDKVIKLDLTDNDTKKVFDDKFRIGTTWTNKNISRKLVSCNPLFKQGAGYDFYNFIVAKDNDVIINALIYGWNDVIICIARDVVHEVDAECEEEKIIRREKWRKLLFPFSR